MHNQLMKCSLILVCIITIFKGGVTPAEIFSAHVSATGAIHLPNDFRITMVHLGSWFVPQGEASGFHDVYTEASTVEAYRKTGRFPDGATLVKALRGAQTDNYTTGANVAYPAETVKQWFVMIKDTQSRFPESPLWGDGWGWALFKPDKPLNNLATNYRVDCLGCHIPAKATDWVYTEAYPTLRTRPAAP